MRLANLCAVAMGIILTGGLAVAQEPEVPLTWKGEGAANLITAEGEDQIQFNLELHVDEWGMVTDTTSNDEEGTVGRVVKVDGLCESRCVSRHLGWLREQCPNTKMLSGRDTTSRFLSRYAQKLSTAIGSGHDIPFSVPIAPYVRSYRVAGPAPNDRSNPRSTNFRR